MWKYKYENYCCSLYPFLYFPLPLVITCLSLLYSIHLIFLQHYSLTPCLLFVFAERWLDFKTLLTSLLLEGQYKIFLDQWRSWTNPLSGSAAALHLSFQTSAYTLFSVLFPDDQGHGTSSCRAHASLCPAVRLSRTDERGKPQRKQASILLKTTWQNSISVSVQQKKKPQNGAISMQEMTLKICWHGYQADY